MTVTQEYYKEGIGTYIMEHTNGLNISKLNTYV